MRISFPIIAILIAHCVHSLAFADESIPCDEARKIRLPTPPAEYAKVKWPKHFRPVVAKYDNTPDANPITNTGATLGRVLFYDTALSANGTKSCASCHKQKLAFTDEEALSIGFDGKPVDRNSMSLVNARFYRNGKMFWDERATTLEEQVLMPIENEIEMGHNLDSVVTQLQTDPIYTPLFEQAFGDNKVTKQRISRALAQFVRSIVSYRSRYDVGRAKVDSVLDDFPNFSKEENYGKTQFFGRGNCASCHMEQSPIVTIPNSYLHDHSTEPTPEPDKLKQTALFFMFAPATNGIDSEDTDDDEGVASHTGKKSDVAKFKVPSLRNIEITGPYMHDGRFHMIEQVIEHYNWSVRPHPNLDPRLKEFADGGMAMPEVEKLALHAFLLTLTDNELIKDEKFSDPFVR